jgi:hypothetical protein
MHRTLRSTVTHNLNVNLSNFENITYMYSIYLTHRCTSVQLKEWNSQLYLEDVSYKFEEYLEYVPFRAFGPMLNGSVILEYPVKHAKSSTLSQRMNIVTLELFANNITPRLFLKETTNNMMERFKQATNQPKGWTHYVHSCTTRPTTLDYTFSLLKSIFDTDTKLSRHHSTAVDKLDSKSMTLRS